MTWYFCLEKGIESSISEKVDFRLGVVVLDMITDCETINDYIKGIYARGIHAQTADVVLRNFKFVVVGRSWVASEEVHTCHYGSYEEF